MAKGARQGLYAGVDVGATKVYAALVKASGRIVARARRRTPRDGKPESLHAAIRQAIEDALAKKQLQPKDLAAIGVGLPGVVDSDAGVLVAAPNLKLRDVDVAGPLEDFCDLPIAVGNDVNLGTLGEKWLGAAQLAHSAVGIFVGTGIGGGLIADDKLLRGAREAAGEVGHMIMQLGGPRCGCGNRGCLEALASRSAIERDLRAAVAAGRPSLIAPFLGKRRAVKSGLLRRALEQKDPLVTEVIRKSAEALGYACLTVRHLLDPDVIVLGGGVIEACGDFIMPIVEKIVAADALPGARPGGRVVRSTLGDDAVVLGAVSLAQELVGRTPLQDMLKNLPEYPEISYTTFGEVALGKKVHQNDIYIRGDGKVKKRDKALARRKHRIGPEELDKVLQGNPEVLIIGTGQTGLAALTAEGEALLRRRGVAFQALPSPRAIRAFNRVGGRKAALIHVTC